MPEERNDPDLPRSGWGPLVRFVGYYLALTAAYFVLTRTSPWMAEHLGGVPQASAAGLDSVRPVEPLVEGAGSAFATAMLTMMGALLLILPVVWVYTWARHKRGFQQSLAQTLVLLPIVVAVVVTVVKHSVALAFSLGGIVGAVAFRHRLEDTKDAIYTFVAIAIGVGVGVQAYSVALAASLFFNLVVLALWLTDFARVPGHLVPALAARRVRLAKEMVPDRHSSQYVAQLDQLLLQSMTPEQLKALADRALERTDAIDLDDGARPARAGTVRLSIRVPVAAIGGARAAAEAVLRRDTKNWQLERIEDLDEGRAVIRYQVDCRRKVPAGRLNQLLRDAVAPVNGELLAGEAAPR
ncbi:MAG: DUF4956 domain-containing protein [Gemmatimonadales bacterium]